MLDELLAARARLDHWHDILRMTACGPGVRSCPAVARAEDGRHRNVTPMCFAVGTPLWQTVRTNETCSRGVSDPQLAATASVSRGQNPGSLTPRLLFVADLHRSAVAGGKERRPSADPPINRRPATTCAPLLFMSAIACPLTQQSGSGDKAGDESFRRRCPPHRPLPPSLTP